MMGIHSEISDYSRRVSIDDDTAASQFKKDLTLVDSVRDIMGRYGEDAKIPREWLIRLLRMTNDADCLHDALALERRVSETWVHLKTRDMQGVLKLVYAHKFSMREHPTEPKITRASDPEIDMLVVGLRKLSEEAFTRALGGEGNAFYVKLLLDSAADKLEKLSIST